MVSVASVEKDFKGQEDEQTELRLNAGFLFISRVFMSKTPL